ncbi:MAG: hypothetical protein J5525_03315 [Lachnospiraceae bacterium]|nr:hypothetical protein [Lachnospiraceae bacterium]
MRVQIIAIVCLTLLILLEIHSVVTCWESDTHRKYVIGHIMAIVFAILAIICQILLMN